MHARQEAIQQGLRHYFTGEPCVHGHIAKRFTGTKICMECNRLYARKNMKDPEYKAKSVERAALWQKENREISNLRCREFYERNPRLVLARTREQQLKRQKRVPAWSEKKAIETFYENCPQGHEVDHIYPLQGKTVSGLHVLGNLQYLPMSVNRSKGNAF
jgi:hypothetical protein